MKPSGKNSRFKLPKAGELVARALRKRIIRGEIEEGEMLPTEQQLMEEFGVSRPTLREAIRILEAEQLVEMKRGLKGGAKVLTPNVLVAARYMGFLMQARQVKLPDLFQTRVMIEPSAVRILARKGSPQTVERLRALVKEAGTISEPSERALAFARFHHILIEETGNETMQLLMSMVSQILDKYLVSVGVVFGRFPDAEKEQGEAHRAWARLADLIEAGKEDEAAELWRNYLHAAEAKLTKWQPAEYVVDLLDDEWPDGG